MLATACVVVLAGCTGSDSDGAASDPNAAGTTTQAAGGSDRAARLVQEGISQARAAKWDQAITTFNNVLVIDPQNKYALYNLGVVAQTRKDAKSAISYYDKALGADQAYTPAMYNKAILLESGQMADAIALYEKITQINPQASTTWFRLSSAYTSQGNAEKAKMARDKALELDPALGKSTPQPSNWLIANEGVVGV